MKLTRIFGIVLGLHVGVIVLVMLQPGCQPGKQDLTLDANETSLVEPDPLNSFNEGVSNQDPVDSQKAKMNLFHLLVQKTEVSSFLDRWSQLFLW